MNNLTRFAWRPVLLALLGASLGAASLVPQSPPGAAGRPRVAIRAIAATPSVARQAKDEGSADALLQIEQGADPQLMDALAGTGRFDLVARADLPSVLKEQDLAQSGNVSVIDPQAARAYQLAGAKYVATVTIGNFQDITERTELLNQFGTSKAERRTISLQATVRVFDTTSGTLFRSANVEFDESATNEILPGVEQKGRKTNVVLGKATRRLASEAAAAIAASMGPAPAPAGGEMQEDSVAGEPVAAPPGAGTLGGTAAAPQRPVRMAIFVKQRPGTVPDEKVATFEDLVSAASTGPGAEVIRREDVVNAVNRLAPSGANAGTAGPDAERVDRLLSDRTSAVQLAAQLRADMLLTASVSQLIKARRRLDDPSTGVATDVEQWTLVTTYGVIDGTTGASLAAGTVQSDFARRDTKELKVEVDAVDALLRDAAARIGPGVRSTVDAARARAAVAASEVRVRLDAVLADLSVPDVRKDASGEYVVGANRYDLQPMAVQVTVDGLAAGNCPGEIPMRPGVHKARFERPGLEPVELTINAREGLAITVPMQLSPEGRANWQRDAMFFNDLKNGAVLRDADLIRVRAVADFLRNSNIRLDTTNVQNLNLGGESLWWQILR
jgi:curli biogenesis system outer membrane secretion channel CsgG